MKALLITVGFVVGFTLRDVMAFKRRKENMRLRNGLQAGRRYMDFLTEHRQ